MKRHLSADEIAAWTIGEVRAEWEEHAGECAACRAEVQHLGSALEEFRGAVQAWSGAQGGEAPAMVRQASQARGRRIPRLRWAVAAIALLTLAAAAPVYRSARERQQAERAAAAARADALLRQVDFEVSRAVPAPMEPLVSLMEQPESSGTSQQSK